MTDCDPLHDLDDDAFKGPLIKASALDDLAESFEQYRYDDEDEVLHRVDWRPMGMPYDETRMFWKVVDHEFETVVHTRRCDVDDLKACLGLANPRTLNFVSLSMSEAIDAWMCLAKGAPSFVGSIWYSASHASKKRKKVE